MLYLYAYMNTKMAVLDYKFSKSLPSSDIFIRNSNCCLKMLRYRKANLSSALQSDL